MANFDLRTTDVPTGLSVIEASAGTGKTWTISHLVPRLLVDGVVSGIGDPRRHSPTAGDRRPGRSEPQ